MGNALFQSTVLLFALLAQSGCTVIIRPTISPSEFLNNGEKLSCTVALYVLDEFREYSSKHADVGDLKQWHLELGPVATDALRCALESRFKNVTVHVNRPQFPLASPAPSLVVVPAFDKVKAAFPVVFKFENYRVVVTMTIRVYDEVGKELQAVTLTGKGKKAGAIGSGSPGHAALPEACRQAIMEIVDQAAEVTAKLSVTRPI